MHRRAVSLIELLIIVGILAILIGLLLPAIQMSRTEAMRLRCANQVKQLTLAVHAYSDASGGKLPRFVQPTESDPAEYIINPTTTVMRYLTGREIPEEEFDTDIEYRGRIYQCASDPSFAHPIIRGNASYGANAVALKPGMTLHTITDGTSHTILWTEHYARCQLGGFLAYRNEPSTSINIPRGDGTVLTVWETSRRASFADAACGDIYPTTVGTPARAVPVVLSPGYPADLFQITPELEKCNPFVPNSSHPAGLVVGLADGSVRTLNRHTTPDTFWAAVTPAGGESVGADW